MAYFDRLVSRDVGQPKAPAVPGGPPRPSLPAQVKNPPGVATAPVGRPSSGPPAFGGAAGTRLPSVQPPAAPAVPTTPGPAARPAMPRPAAPAAAPAASPTTPPAALPGAGSMAVNFDRVPSAYEISQAPEGTAINTPYGPIDRSGNIQFTPEGEQKYKEAVVSRRKDFGPHPWAADPAAPPPPARMGGSMINPFTGVWTK